MDKMQTIEKLFARNTRKMVLIPFAILFLLSLILTLISQYYIRQKTSDSSQSDIDFVNDSVQGILSETLSLRYAFDNNISLARTLRNILRADALSFQDRHTYTIVQTTLLSQMYAKLYMNSLYLYYDNNEGRFFVTDVFHSSSYISKLSGFSDTAWFDSYQAESLMPYRIWTERREITTASLSAVPAQPVISLFNRLYTSGTPRSIGVLVVNLDLHYLENAIAKMLSSSQHVFVFNEWGELFLQSDNDVIRNDSIPDIDWTSPPKKLSIDHISYDVYISTDTEFGWHYMMLIKSAEQLALLRLPLFFMICISAAAFLIQFVSAYVLVKKNRALVQDIFLVLESAEKGLSLPILPKTQNETERLVHNALIDFIENKYYKISRREAFYHSQVMELLALQNQMNPHFLFNALHTISWKAISLTRSENDVSRMLENLSSILRYSLREPLQMVSLQEEVYIAECYIHIENMRFGNKYEVEWRCQVDSDKYKVPKLIIQPLLENCILHAFSARKENCRMRIRLFEEKQMLNIRVTDNGIGIERETLERLTQNFQHRENETLTVDHMGLINVHKRLRLLFGQKAGIRIVSIPSLSTAVQIRIPIN